jgi:hypothetical protein
VEFGVDGPCRHAMGLSKSSDSDTPVIGDLGGNIGDESQIADSAFAVEEPLVGSRFPLLHFTDDLVQLQFLQGRVPIDLFHRLNGFPATARAPTKSRIGSMAYSRGGEERRVTGGPATANQLIRGRGGPKQKLLVMPAAPINILSPNLSGQRSARYGPFTGIK